MLLQNKSAVIYGGGGAIRGAVASTLGPEGTKVCGTPYAGRGLIPPMKSSVAAVAEAAEVTRLTRKQCGSTSTAWSARRVQSTSCSTPSGCKTPRESRSSIWRWMDRPMRM
jgi:hypothetical protein